MFSFKNIVTSVSHSGTIRTFVGLKLGSTRAHLSGCRRANVFRRLRRNGLATRKFQSGLKRLYEHRLAVRRAERT